MPMLHSRSRSQFETQTDWSGGPGVVGPVTTLGSEFLLDTDVFCGSPFDLVLQIGLEHTVDGDFNYATSVYSTDVNGDGYMDILGASDDDDITWWENVDGLGNTLTEHTVDGDFNGAWSVNSDRREAVTIGLKFGRKKDLHRFGIPFDIEPYCYPALMVHNDSDDDRVFMPHFCFGFGMRIPVR